ncbi:MAG: hypothetical protein MZV70_55960 [Desulfobacterales bacterium]|nr:hypothetical protein [Desulfobacterales bacterium]
MKTRLVIVMAMVCLTAGIWALPARGDESPADQQKSYYLKCINKEIDNYSCKVVLTSSRSKNLQAYGENAALRTAFLSQNRDALVQEMIAQKVSMRPHAVQQYLRQRFNQEASASGCHERP